MHYSTTFISSGHPLSTSRSHSGNMFLFGNRTRNVPTFMDAENFWLFPTQPNIRNFWICFARTFCMRDPFKSPSLNGICNSRRTTQFINILFFLYKFLTHLYRLRHDSDLWCTPLRWLHVACYIHSNFHKDWYRRSSYIRGFSQKFEKLKCWYYWWEGFMIYVVEMA
jgi:hypothetical protein